MQSLDRSRVLQFLRWRRSIRCGMRRGRWRCSEGRRSRVRTSSTTNGRIFLPFPSRIELRFTYSLTSTDLFNTTLKPSMKCLHLTVLRPPRLPNCPPRPRSFRIPPRGRRDPPRGADFFFDCSMMSSRDMSSLSVIFGNAD